MTIEIQNPQTETLRRQLRQAEKRILTATLTQYDNRDDAANALGVSRSTLWRKMAVHDLV